MSHHHDRNGTPVCSIGAGELFNGFFKPGKQWDLRKDHLVDARARRVFEMMGRACEAGVYPYQLPLEGRSGPWVQAEGRQMMMLSSYDYLGLIGHPRIDEAAIRGYPEIWHRNRRRAHVDRDHRPSP